MNVQVVRDRGLIVLQLFQEADQGRALPFRRCNVQGRLNRVDYLQTNESELAFSSSLRGRVRVLRQVGLATGQ